MQRLPSQEALLRPYMTPQKVHIQAMYAFQGRACTTTVPVTYIQYTPIFLSNLSKSWVRNLQTHKAGQE
eukprot:1140396-Pelagomonas_calceolata.AAC.2